MKLYDNKYKKITAKNFNLNSKNFKKLIFVSGIIILNIVVLSNLPNKKTSGGVQENLKSLSFENNIDYIEVDNDIDYISFNENKNIQKISIHQESIVYNNENSLIEQHIKKYTNIYGLKYDVVYNKIKEITNNFTDEKFINNNNIEGSRILKMERSYNSLELGVLVFIRHISQIPEDFDLTYDEIVDYSNKYELTSDYFDKVKYYCDLFEHLPAELCMAIIYSESGKNIDSNAFLNLNNPAGLMSKDGNTLLQFKNKEVGLIETISILNYQYMVDKDLIDKDIDYVIKTIKDSYSPDGVINDPTNLNNNWISNVMYFYNQLKDTTELNNNSYHTKR